MMNSYNGMKVMLKIKTAKTCKLNSVEKQMCFEFVFYFEKVVKNSYGAYDWNSDLLRDFCKSNQIRKKGNRSTTGFNFFRFETKKRKEKGINDMAFYFMKHIRNSIAHANFVKVSKNRRQYYEIKDYNQNKNKNKNKNKKETMYGIIETSLFWSMLNIIINDGRNEVD